MHSRHFLPGQVGLMLLVVMALVIGLVLSIASRSLSDTVLSRQEKENTAAFSLAESGVEEALRALSLGNSSSNWTTIADSSGLYSANYSVGKLASFEMGVKEGEAIEVAISSLANNTNLTISWTKALVSAENLNCSGSQGSGTNPAALAVTVVTSSGGSRRGYYNPYNCTIAGNGFAGASSAADPFRSQQTVTKQSGDLLLRVAPLYNGATIKIAGSGLSEAMFRVASVSEGGDARKEIEVKRSRDAAGSIFDYALFSGSTVLHN